MRWRISVTGTYSEREESKDESLGRLDRSTPALAVSSQDHQGVRQTGIRRVHPDRCRAELRGGLGPVGTDPAGDGLAAGRGGKDGSDPLDRKSGGEEK